MCCHNLISSIFFEWFRDPPTIPSFPTRRSSDLPAERLRLAPLVVDAELGRVPLPAAGRVFADDLVEYGRSEEHTAELQSPYDLVCRLLLEKKKTKTINLLVDELKVST